MSLLFCVWADQQEEDQEEENRNSSDEKDDDSPDEDEDAAVSPVVEARQGHHTDPASLVVVDRTVDGTPSGAQVASVAAAPPRPRPRIGPKSRVKKPESDDGENFSVGNSGMHRPGKMY